MKKDIQIGDKILTMEATAGTPRRYRMMFHRDLMADMSRLEKQYKKNKDTEEEFDALDLTIFENVAFLMAKQAGSISDNSIETWLDSFDMFDIYNFFLRALSNKRCGGYESYLYLRRLRSGQKPIYLRRNSK